MNNYDVKELVMVGILSILAFALMGPIGLVITGCVMMVGLRK